jgi:hypothetical protein
MRPITASASSALHLPLEDVYSNLLGHTSEKLSRCAFYPRENCISQLARKRLKNSFATLEPVATKNWSRMAV